MIKIFTYFDEWLNYYIEFHKSLTGLAQFYVPMSEMCLLLILLYYFYKYILYGRIPEVP
jgi:hypothetical protein